MTNNPSPRSPSLTRSLGLACASEPLGRDRIHGAINNSCSILIARYHRRKQAVEHDIQHRSGIAVEWITITTAAWTIGDEAIAALHFLVGYLRRQLLARSVRGLHHQLTRAPL